MTRIIVISIIMFYSTSGFSEKREVSEIINVEQADVEMNTAMEKANKSLDIFIKRFKNPKKGDSNFSLKVKLTDSNGTEHFWVNDILVKEGGFEGYIANEARVVKSVSLGQKVSFNSSSVTDWAYDINGVKQGAFTLKVMIKRMPKGQADYYLNYVGWKDLN